jgi:hypothetical protein
MKDKRYNPPIPVEVVWKDAIGVQGEVDLSAPKGIVLRYIGYLAEVRDGFVTLVSEYADECPESMRDQGDIPLVNVLTITRLTHGRTKLYDKSRMARRNAKNR